MSFYFETQCVLVTHASGRITLMRVKEDSDWAIIGHEILDENLGLKRATKFIPKSAIESVELLNAEEIKKLFADGWGQTKLVIPASAKVSETFGLAGGIATPSAEDLAPPADGKPRTRRVAKDQV